MTAKKLRCLEVGTYKDPEHYAIIGRPADFYVWKKERGEYGSASNWIIGRVAFELYNKFRGLLESKDKDGFIRLAREVHKKYGGK